MAHLIVRNKLTGNEYTITDKEWDQIKETNQAKKFTIVERVEEKTITITKEVEKIVRGNQTKKDSND